MQLLLSLGANLGSREETLQKAVELLQERIGSLVACSSFCETQPVGFQSCHPFLNAAAVFETTLPAERVLDITQNIEQELGRTQKSVDGKYTDRTIDIDLLIFGETVVETPNLTIPHPRMQERRFVLEPLAEIAPRLRHPVSGKTVTELLDELNRPRISRVFEASDDVLEAVNVLLPQLSTTAKALTRESFADLLRREGTFVYIIRDELSVVRAMATLCLCASPTGTKAWAEDLVVDASARGRGYARALLQHLKTETLRLGAKSLNLTSRPGREAANRLYRNEGFELRETNVYRQTTNNNTSE